MKQPIVFVANCSFKELNGNCNNYLVRESSRYPLNLTVSYFDKERGLLNTRICFAKGQWQLADKVDKNEISAPDGDAQKLLNFLERTFNRTNLLLPKPDEASSNVIIYKELPRIESREEEEHHLAPQKKFTFRPLFSPSDLKPEQNFVFTKNSDSELKNAVPGTWLVRESSNDKMLTVSRKESTSAGNKIRCFRCVCVNGEWYEENEIPSNIVIDRTYQPNPQEEAARLLEFLEHLGFEEKHRLTPSLIWKSTHPYFHHFTVKASEAVNPELNPISVEEYFHKREQKKAQHRQASIVTPNPHTETVFKDTVEIDGVNIYECPAVSECYQVKQGSEITLGDLHANTMKLLFTLVFHGIARIPEENYQELSKIYKKDKHERKDYQQFAELLESMEFVDETIRKTLLIRLVGDDFADRGRNDFFTMLLLNKLASVKIQVKSLASNHTIEFIEAIEKELKRRENEKALPAQAITGREEEEITEQLDNPQESVRGSDFEPSRFFGFSVQKSMILLKWAIEEDKTVDWEEVVSLYNNIYRPMSCVLSYTLDHENNGITLYSHAPIDVEVIQNLAKAWEVKYDDRTPQALAASIDRINQHYQQYAGSNQIHKLYDPQDMTAAASEYNLIDKQKNPFLFLMWNRDYTAINRSAQHNGYFVSYVHGHDSGELIASANVRNLDNELGKYDEKTLGKYTAVCTMRGPALAKTREATVGAQIEQFGFLGQRRQRQEATSSAATMTLSS
ncbi:hypothetical protein [Legionella clemsonensis]|uniref:WipA-like phosphatase domain-containing protein n=1 Tax=Legionella clemsonensis TaxID=1867846 RepID=A0A222P0C8_9GAMM|nr:hypothetical protein [Legionella clemsonensis]ASQ45286.1 hypothetical protein clem_03640 [Legionella clemsonensis]